MDARRNSSLRLEIGVPRLFSDNDADNDNNNNNNNYKNVVVGLGYK